MAADDDDNSLIEAPRAVNVGVRHRQRGPMAAVASVSLALGFVLGLMMAPAFDGESSDVVNASAGADNATTVVKPPSELSPDRTLAETTLPTLAPGPRDDEAPQVAPSTRAAAPPVQRPEGQQAPARQRFAATLEAEAGWAPTDRFAATITVVELDDGSWSASVAAEGLQPGHRHGAGVSWDAPFFSSFCVGMSDEAGRWTCTGSIDMQHVSSGAKLIGGDLGEASGRIWAHGSMRPA